MTPEQRSTNHWASRVERERTADATPRERGLNNDRIYVAAVVAVWIIAEMLYAYRTLPGGIGMLPMFVFMSLFATSLCLWGWRNRDSFND